MSEPKNTTGQKKPTNKGTQPGKVKGAGNVKATPQPAPEKPLATEGELAKQSVGSLFDQAFNAGYKASQDGTPNRPYAGYTDMEVRAWYAGYKQHANPNTRGTVEGIEQGYRKDY